jgi:hypothetical protein
MALPESTGMLERPTQPEKANHPGVVGKRVEATDHGRAAGVEAYFGALVYVADVEEDGVGIGAPPLTNLAGAAAEAAEVGVIVVIDCGQDVAVKIGGVKNGDGYGFRLAGPELGGKRGEQSPLPEHPQKPASTERGRVDVHELGLWDQSRRV